MPFIIITHKDGHDISWHVQNIPKIIWFNMVHIFWLKLRSAVEKGDPLIRQGPSRHRAVSLSARPEEPSACEVRPMWCRCRVGNRSNRSCISCTIVNLFHIFPHDITSNTSRCRCKKVKHGKTLEQTNVKVLLVYCKILQKILLICFKYFISPPRLHRRGLILQPMWAVPAVHCGDDSGEANPCSACVGCGSQASTVRFEFAADFNDTPRYTPWSVVR